MRHLLCPRRDRTFSRLLPLLAALLLVAGLPGRAHAQCRILADGTVFCDDGGGADGDPEPFVGISPASLKTSQPTVPVTISMADDRLLVDSTFHVYVDGVDVKSTFSYARTSSSTGVIRSRATATGMVRLSTTGATTVSARICDNAPVRQCVSNADPVSYTLTLPGVSVSPDAGTAAATAGTGRTQAFTVTNTGTEPATFSFTVDCRDAETGGAVGGCTAPGALTLAAGASQAVQATFSATAGQSLTVGLSARQQNAAGVQDAGWVDVTVQGAAGPDLPVPLIRQADLASGAYPVLRGQCVTVSAGPGAAYECGDLRLAHALPTHRTLGRAWGPALLYNSQHADPRPTLYFDVTLPANAEVPWQMMAVIYFAATGQQVQVPFNGAEWQPGTTRRIAVQIDGSSMATGEHVYYAQVLANTNSGRQGSSAVLASALTVVNRANSHFGAGWWLAGLESLCMSCGANGSALWIGGDGSTRRYVATYAGSGQWVSQNPDGAPDTLTLAAGPVYVRKLPGGGRVEFNSAGQHVRTVNRLGQQTLFEYPNGLLTRIVVPAPAGATAPAWWFAYTPGGVLTEVAATAPGAATRSVMVGYELGGGRVTYLRDPDTMRVRFAYGNAARPNVVTQRTDRRGTPLAFRFSASGRLTSTRVTLESGDSIVARFQPVEDRGLGQSVPLAAAYTLLDGPRTDVADRTYIWHTDRGAPRRIRDALGGETVITRADGRFPALATEVVAPNGVKSTATYDARGRVSQSVVYGPLGDARYTLARYAYDDRWDLPTEVRSDWVDGATGVSTPLSGTAYAAYDAVGNATWQQQGDDAARRVSFRYYPSGQLRAVQAPAVAAGTAVDSLVYDGAGNLLKTISPTGLFTLHYRDALGRDTLTLTPTDTGTESALLAAGVRQRTVYDVMDRVVHGESVGPARSYTAVNSGFAPAATPQERLEVNTVYDPEGAALSVHRFATPDYDGGVGFLTEYTYDRAGRMLRDSSSQAGVQVFTRDPAGNVVVSRTGAGYEVSMQYDALGRLIRRTVPERTYVKQCDDILLIFDCESFPRFPNYGDGYRVAEEWSHYRYDAAGNQVYAENADARVQRTYFPSGALRTDSAWIRGATDVTYAAYGLRYTYDMAGRVTALEHPANLTGSTVRPDSFYYHPVTGALARGVSRLRHGFDFYNAANGQVTSLRLPGAIVDSMRYDLEGRLVWRNESGPSAGVLHAETMQYDARGKLLHADNGASTFHNWYSGLGSLVGTDWYNLTQNVGRVAEELRTDPLGSTTLRRTSVGADGNGGEFPQYQNIFQPSTGRLIAMRQLPPLTPSSNFAQDSTGRRYDAGGNVTRTYQRVAQQVDGGVQPGHEVETRTYYGADDRLRAFQKMDVRRTDWSNHEDAGVWEEYRYDALGRRVMVITRTDGGLCNYEAWGCTPSTTAFVWAGDQLLWELKSASGTYASAAGGNVSYLHAGGIDRPLVITKGSTSIVPHQNWRGEFARGTYADGVKLGQRSDCTSFPASGCIPIQWPGERTTARHELEADGNIQNWFGGLVDGMRDASGQMYMRNRYYDPQSGQFTQADPIGLGGGLNAYGFAAGDPVSYADPYGLCPEWLTNRPCTLQDAANFAAGFGDAATLGLTRHIRRNTAGGDAVEYESGLYTAGSVTGAVAVSVATYGVAAEAQAARIGADGRALMNAEPVGAALKPDVFHRAATFARNEAGRVGTHFRVRGGDGVTRTLTQVAGEVNGTAGRFEYIVDRAGKLTHQLFVPGGRINGVPIKP
jgi:RHS repeat-associated protein